MAGRDEVLHGPAPRGRNVGELLDVLWTVVSAVCGLTVGVCAALRSALTDEVAASQYTGGDNAYFIGVWFFATCVGGVVCTLAYWLPKAKLGRRAVLLPISLGLAAVIVVAVTYWHGGCGAPAAAC